MTRLYLSPLYLEEELYMKNVGIHLIEEVKMYGYFLY